MLLPHVFKEFAHLLGAGFSSFLVVMAAGTVPVVLFGVFREKFLDDCLQLGADILRTRVFELLNDVQVG